MPPAPNQNRLLSVLSADVCSDLLDRSVPVDLPLKMVLYEAERAPAFAYFLTPGMASVVTLMKNGGTAEVGVVGCEGVVGGIHLLGPGKVPTDSFIQLEGTGFRIPMPELRKLFQTSEEIRRRILEHVQEQTLSVTQLAGCNRLHEAEERLARWLLMAKDRTQSEVLEFTQEFLGMMLGSRRTTVTLVAGALQRIGLIEYSRGRVKILDRDGLESAACDCYQITKSLYTNLYSSPLTDAGSGR